MGKYKKTILWLIAAFLCLLSAGCFCVPGYRFSGCVCLGCASILICYWLLQLLERKNAKTAKLLRRIFTVCLCVFLLAYAVTGAIIVKAGHGHPEQDCDYLIVLGAGVNGTVPSLSLRERLDAAYEYLNAHPETICIVSGGQGNGEDITEALCMFLYLQEAGIDPSRILMEDQATSTQENLAFSLRLMERTEHTRIGILSSEYHLLRAKLMAHDQGFDPILIPAKTTWLSLRLNYYMREVAGVWYYLILGGQHHDFSFLCRPCLVLRK